jgi:hypothetical protein
MTTEIGIPLLDEGGNITLLGIPGLIVHDVCYAKADISCGRVAF